MRRTKEGPPRRQTEEAQHCKQQPRSQQPYVCTPRSVENARVSSFNATGIAVGIAVAVLIVLGVYLLYLLASLFIAVLPGWTILAAFFALVAVIMLRGGR